MSGETVFLAGAGLMGSDIALLFADTGYHVILYDINRDALAKAKEKHETDIEELVEKGLLVDRTSYRNIEYTMDLDKARDADFVFEAIVEDLKIKREFFTELERFISPETVIATNTSSYTISELSEGMEKPDRLVGMHFSNPPIEMDLVEVVGGKKTSEDAIATVLEKSIEINKRAIMLDRECRGFVLNRLLYAAFTDVLLRLDSGEKPEEIDRGIMNLGVPYGPVEGMDLIGLDTVIKILDNLIEAYGDRFSYPKHILYEKVDKGLLGKKSGTGFYKWESGRAIIPDAEPADPLPTVAVAINEAYRIMDEGIVDKVRVDDIYKLGVKAPLGLFETAELLGMEELSSILEKRFKETSHTLYKPYGLG